MLGPAGEVSSDRLLNVEEIQLNELADEEISLDSTPAVPDVVEILQQRTFANIGTPCYRAPEIVCYVYCLLFLKINSCFFVFFVQTRVKVNYFINLIAY